MMAVLLLGMAGAGVWLHLKTQDAWNARFQKHDAPPSLTQSDPASPATTTKKDALIAEIRERRERAEVEAKMTEVRLRSIAAQRADADQSKPAKKDEFRCINGIAFRRIPGGWENVPGEYCP